MHWQIEWSGFVNVVDCDVIVVCIYVGDVGVAEQLVFGIPSPTHSFIPGSNLPPLQIFPTAALPFFYLNIHYVDSPDCLLLFLSISVFYF